ncbi:MAG: ABC transporter ATP-binding protein [Bacillota bacterium]|nr:ABC transporter ATP-binding protein [Bacillota bacterium]
MTPRICFETVHVSFTTASGSRLEAVHDVSLDIADKEFTVLVGPSGCGKSTLLNVAAGLVVPDCGRVLIDGRPVTGPEANCGYVFQEFALFPWKTVRANIEFGLKMHGVPKAEREKIADRYIELVGLREFASAYPGQLSGGMKQRVAIARAYAYNPDILLMDEPFGALDALTRTIMQEELIDLWRREQKTVLFVTHGVDEAIYLADKVVVLTARPARIKAVFELTADHLLPEDRYNPHIKSSSEFRALSDQIWELVREEGRGSETRAAVHRG